MVELAHVATNGVDLVTPFRFEAAGRTPQSLQRCAARVGVHVSSKPARVPGWYMKIFTQASIATGPSVGSSPVGSLRRSLLQRLGRLAAARSNRRCVLQRRLLHLRQDRSESIERV